MSIPLVECVPNFSEGRRPEIMEQIAESIRKVPGAYVLDLHSDPDHNRSVITFVGEPAAVEEAAFQMIQMAASVIDMNEHSGEHPRIGATDVVPLIPISNITMQECVEMAHRLGERVGQELGIPVYFYEQAARRPDRRRLELVRRGEYEGLLDTVSSDPDRKPDSGPAEMGTAGATVIGAREFLIAYNVNLTTDQEEIASKIARAVRHSSGGLRYVKALGMLVEGRAQVSMNLTNFRKTPLARVVEFIRREAERYGVGIHNSELVGLIPQQALVDAAVWHTQLDLFSPDQILEQKMQAAVGAAAPPDFSAELAAPTPTPGGGSAAAFSGAMAAGLVAMVARLTIGKKGYEAVEGQMDQILEEAENLRQDLKAAVDEDAEAFNQVMLAYKIPKSEPTRSDAIQEATMGAALVPLTVAQKALRVGELALEAARLGNINAATDAGSAVNLSAAAVKSAAYNVRINLTSLEQSGETGKLLKDLKELEEGAYQAEEQIHKLLADRCGLF